MTFRPATLDDCALLARLNHELIRDEGHRNPMTVPQLEQRMRGWISGDFAIAKAEGLLLRLVNIQVPLSAK